VSTLLITIYNCKFLRSCATRSEEDLRWLSATSDPWCRCCRENISSRKIVLAFAAGSWRRPAGSWRPRREGIRRRTRPSAGERWCCARRATFFCRLIYHKLLSSLWLKNWLSFIFFRLFFVCLTLLKGHTTTKFRLVCYAFLLVSDFLPIFGSLISFGQFVLLNESVQVGGFLLVLTLEVAVDAQVQLVPVLNLFVVNLKQVFQSWFSGSKRFNSNFSIKGFFSAN